MKNLFILIFLLYFSCSIFAQSVVYDTLIENNYDYRIDDALEDYQNNTIFVGTKGKWSNLIIEYDYIYLMKLNPMGNLLAYKEINTKMPLMGSRLSITGTSSLLLLPNNQYLLATNMLETDSVHTQMAFFVLDINFNILQSYELGEIGKSEYFTCILKDKYNDFIITYDKECTISGGNAQVVVSKFDNQFMLKNTFELPDCLINGGVSYTISKQAILEKTNNKGYYIFRHKSSSKINEMWDFDENLQFQKLDSLFSTSTTTYNTPNLCASWIDKQKQVIIGGSSPSIFTLKSDINYIIRDTTGNVLHQDSLYYYSSSEVTGPSAIANRLNHDFYLGFTKDFDGNWGGAALSKYMLLKIDEFGNKKWQATYGDSAGQYVMYKALATSDGGVIMAGTRMMDNRPAVDTVRHGIYIVKIMDNSLKINTPILAESMYTLFPNPADNKLNISLLENIHAQIELFDLQGKKLIEKGFLKEAEIEIKGLSKGLYMYRILDEKGRSVSGKWEKR